MHRFSSSPPLHPGPPTARDETRPLVRFTLPIWTGVRPGHDEIPACPACRGSGCATCVGTGLTSDDVNFAALRRDRGIARLVA